MNETGVAKGQLRRDVRYGPDPEQCLDLYLPAAPSRAPWLLLVHGGGWSVGDKNQYAVVGARLAREGVVTAIINYRLSPAVQHPAHVEDVAWAIAWGYQHGPEYGWDPEQLWLMGHSSGAHLAALAALDPRYLAAHALAPTMIRGVVGIAGVAYDLDAHYQTPSLAQFFNPVFGEDTTNWAEAAPIRYVAPLAPPFLLVHGLSDSEAPPAVTEALAAALRRAGVATQLVLLPGEGHISAVLAAAPLVIDFIQAREPSSPVSPGV